MSVPEELPVVSCRWQRLGALSAEAGAANWLELPAVMLADAVTGAPPKQKTLVRTAWDEREWRVLFQVMDTHVWATYTERDSMIYEEEVVEVFLDPVGDFESYFEIEINPLNTILDLVLRRNRSGYAKDFSWDCEDLRSVVKRTAAGWCAELSIPWSSLIAEPPRDGARWRGNFCRIDRPADTPRELTAWSTPGRANFHTPERFGWIEFSRQ